MKFLHIVLFFVAAVHGIQSVQKGHDLELRDTSQQLLSRKRRWLVWKKGINWVSVIFGIGIPVNLNYHSITLGMVMKAFYQLPNNSSYYTRPSIDLVRKKRSATRWKLYDMIENYLDRNNYPDGKACLLKSICEISAVPLEQKTGLIAEIFHSILTPSSTDDEIENHAHNEYHAAEMMGKKVKSCSYAYPECPDDPVKQFSKLTTVNKFVY